MFHEFKNKLVWIIDDESDIVEVLSSIIKLHIDVNISGFSCPIDAIEKLKSGLKPNLFIVDIKMPKLNGLDFIAEIKKMQHNVPVIIISGHAEKNEAIQSLKLGVFKLLNKPISYDIFIHSILQALTLEEITTSNEFLKKENEQLINLFQKFVNKSHERITEVENLILDKTNILQEDKQLLKNFIERIHECNIIDKEILQVYNEISMVKLRKEKLQAKIISQEYFDKNLQRK